MHLMCYAPTNWLDMVAMIVEGAMSRGSMRALQDVAEGCKLVFYTWAQFKEAMVQQFVLVTKVEEVHK